jgi:hypothetical protein
MPIHSTARSFQGPTQRLLSGSPALAAPAGLAPPSILGIGPAHAQLQVPGIRGGPGVSNDSQPRTRPCCYCSFSKLTGWCRCQVDVRRPSALSSRPTASTGQSMTRSRLDWCRCHSWRRHCRSGLGFGGRRLPDLYAGGCAYGQHGRPISLGMVCVCRTDTLSSREAAAISPRGAERVQGPRDGSSWDPDPVSGPGCHPAWVEQAGRLVGNKRGYGAVPLLTRSWTNYWRSSLICSS